MAKTYWQVAAGSYGREYTDAFIKYGMAFVGGDENTKAIQRVSKGDVMILKSGLSKIVAAGEVTEQGTLAGEEPTKQWLLDFDGWNLDGFCYVDWRKPPKAVKTSGLAQATIKQAPQEKHQEIAERILQLPAQPRSPEPAPTHQLKDEEILESLINEGLRPSAADDLTNTIRRIRLLAGYYYRGDGFWWDDVREHETRTFLVVPLLLALGWTEQQIKIELPCAKGKIDLACFARPYRRQSSDCVLIIETKAFSQGLEYAPDQAKRYATGYPKCQLLMVTNGFCYKMYANSANGFEEEPTAYMNILRPTARYPLDPVNVGGAQEILRRLLPSSLWGE